MPIPIRVRIAETVVSAIAEHLGDLGAREAQPPQRGDQLDSLLGGAVVDPSAGRGAVEQSPSFALGAVARHPLARRVRSLTSAAAAASRQRPLLIDDPLDQQLGACSG